MSPVPTDTMGGNRVELEQRRLLDRASEIIQRPDFAGYNTDLNAQGLHNNDMRGRVVQELLKDKSTIPSHLHDEQSLDAHLLEEHLRAQREALKAQEAVLSAKKSTEEEGSWLTRSLQTVKTGMSNVGSHLWRHKWKYAALAAAIGAGWYYSGYIIPWLQQMRGIVPQNALDTAAAAGTEAAPVITPAAGAASESQILGQLLPPTPIYPDATTLPAGTQLFNGAAATPLPAVPTGSLSATPANVLNAFGGTPMPTPPR